MTSHQTRIDWRPEFETGDAAIDHEHAALVDLLNEVFARLDAGGPADEIDAFLGEVYARISAHFALEEQVMQSAKYDELAEHKADHEFLLDEVRDLMDAHEDGTYIEFRDAFAERLRSWFVEHFKTRDARLHEVLGPHA